MHFFLSWESELEKVLDLASALHACCFTSCQQTAIHDILAMAETSIPASPSKDEQRAGRARKGARHSKEQTALALKEEKVTGKKRQKQQGQQQGSGFTVKPSSSAAWPFVRLSDSQGSKSTNSLPPIYSKDGR